MCRKPRRKPTSFKSKLIIMFIVLLITTAYMLFEYQIEPSFLDITRIKAEELCNDAVNTAIIQVIEKNKYTYTDFAKVSTNDKAVTSIITDSINVNKMKSQVALQSQENINDMGGTEINYKLGDFCGAELLNGRGPELCVKIFFSASISVDIKSTFETSGINQTKHTLNVVVTSRVYITSEDGLETYTTVVTNVPVVENIIVGSTPALYTGNWGINNQK